ncbi:MAG: SPASM domain-containing protein [Oscillospiraceae bacterium]|nr:SPASM domain-containing protein [Oscillospiraceae bacterium]
MITYTDKIKKIYIELTQKCNLNCRACFRVNWKNEPIDMQEDVFLKILNDDVLSETTVIGGIGEPTAHPRFVEYSKRLMTETEGKQSNLEITSNAYHWDNQIIETLVKYYQKVTVSVDGLPQTFLNARGFEYDVLAQNVKKLIDAKKATNSKTPVIHAIIVLSKDNINEIKDLIPLLKKTGFAYFMVSNLLPQTEEDKDKIIYTPYLDEKRRRFVYAWYPIACANSIPMKTPMTKFSSEHRCAFVEQEAIFITADGSIAPCYRFAHDGQEFVFGRKKKVRAHYFGNILDNTLTEIWNTHDYYDFRYRNYASRYPSCIDCDYVECCDYITTSEADCRANEPSCADCLWCRELIECP